LQKQMFKEIDEKKERFTTRSKAEDKANKKLLDMRVAEANLEALERDFVQDDDSFDCEYMFLHAWKLMARPTHVTSVPAEYLLTNGAAILTALKDENMSILQKNVRISMRQQSGYTLCKKIRESIYKRWSEKRQRLSEKRQILFVQEPVLAQVL
jgi:hypothetical protein